MGRDDPAPIGAIERLDSLIRIQLHGSVINDLLDGVGSGARRSIYQWRNRDAVQVAGLP